MKKQYNSILFFLLSILVIASCRKRPDPVPVVNHPVIADTPKLKIVFENTVNGVPLVLGSTYKNANNDSFLINTYKYYISNIQLFSSDGSSYNESESYHLISQEIDNSKTFYIKNLPSGNYNKIHFLIGVDSLRCVSGAQSGDLDPILGMFWDWESGYVMAKLEGNSPQSPSGYIAYHITGYAGPYNTLKWVTLELPNEAIVKKDRIPVIHIQSNIAEWFKDPKMVKFSEMPFATIPGKDAATMATNYADMFSISSVE